MKGVRADARSGAAKLHAPTKDGRVKSFMDHEDSVYSDSLRLLTVSTFKSLCYCCYVDCRACLFLPGYSTLQ